MRDEQKKEAGIVSGAAGKRFVRPWRGPTGWHWLILAAGMVGLAWIVVGPWYYNWVLGDEYVDIQVFCDTSDLETPDFRAFVLYDKVALSPPARVMGLFQNRDPEEVRVFFFVPAEELEITPVSVRLKSVPYGPVSRVLFIADGKKFHADIKDRRLFDNTIYVRVPGSLPYPVIHRKQQKEVLDP